MQIIKLLATSLLVFSLNINLFADSGNFNERAVRAIASDADSADSDATPIPPLNNPKVDEFIKVLFDDPNLYVKWLGALEISVRDDDNFVSMDTFLTNNGCSPCTYLEVMQAISTKRANHLIFWTGSYQTNLISASGTGTKLNLVIDQSAEVRLNKVIGTALTIDGRAIFGAQFKNFKLTWDYGTTMQPNYSRGSIAFAEVFLNGSYVGHQFTGTIVRQAGASMGEDVESFIGFTNIAALPLIKGLEGDDSDGDSGDDDSDGDDSDGDSSDDSDDDGDSSDDSDDSDDDGDSSDGDDSDDNSNIVGVTIKVLDNTTSETGGTAKFSMVLDAKPIFGPGAIKNEFGEPVVAITMYSSNENEGKFKGGLAGLTFTKDNWHIPREVIVYGQNDGVDNDDQSYQIIFSSDYAYDSNYAGLVIDPITLTNSASTAAAGVTIKVLDNTTSEAGDTAKFSMVLDAKPIFGPGAMKNEFGDPVVVIAMYSSNESEGKFKGRLIGLTFTKDNWHIPRETIVYGQDDGVNDGNQSYQIIFSSGYSYNSNYAGLVIDPITLTNFAIGATVKVLDSTTSETGGTAKFSIVLNDEPIFGPSALQNSAGEKVIVIDMLTDNPSEGRFANNAINSSVTFTKNNWNAPVEFTIYGRDDTMGDGDKPYQIKFSVRDRNAQDTSYKDLTINPIHLTNIDNDDTNLVTGEPQMTVGFIDYPAKKFGTQIWTTKSMRHYPSKAGMGFWSGFDDNGDEFKFYNWNAAMNGETTEGAQGICAPGWHVPTDDDWKTLEAFLGMRIGMVDEDDAYRGTDQGTQLLAGGSSEFNAQLVGYHANADIKSHGLGVRFITSTSKSDALSVSRYIGEHHNPVRYILLKQSSASLQTWSFSEVEAIVDGTNIALGATAQFSGAGLYIVEYQPWPLADKNISEEISKALRIHVRSTYSGYSNTGWIYSSPDVAGHSSLTDGLLQTGLSYGRTNSNNLKNRNGNGLTVKPNGYVKIDLGAEYPIDSIRLRGFLSLTKNSNAPFAVSHTFAGNKIVVFTSQSDIDGSQTMAELALDSSIAMRVGHVVDGAQYGAQINTPQPNSNTHFKENVATAVWRGAGQKSVGALVRCVKGSNYDSSISVHTPKEITLEVGKPMTPIGFGDSVTSVTKNWSITPMPLSHGLVFDTKTGILSGTPMFARGAATYQVRTADESKAVSSITITIVDSTTLVSSIQITGNNRLKVGESTQLSATISPADASNKKVVWSVVEAAGGAKINQKGKLTALRPGYVKVFAMAADNSASYSTFYVAINASTQSDITFNHRKYSALSSNKTGRVWLDRNLGASRACSATTDTACYGELYQWGRGADGHQVRDPDPALTNIQATSLKPGHGKFIGPLNDWVTSGVDNSGNKRRALWMGDGVDRICPTGFTLPTADELQVEKQDQSNLKWPLNGWRDQTSGQVVNEGVSSHYWTREYDGSGHPYALGLGVRCVKQQPQPFISPSISTLTTLVNVAITPITFTNLGAIATQWKITPALPAGLVFNTQTGAISGTPSERMPATYYRITASNASGANTTWVRITVDIKPILITDIRIVSPKTIVSPHDAVQLKVVVNPSNADHDVSWSSLNTEIATVDETGLVTALAKGVSTIVARSKHNPNVSDLVRITVADYQINNTLNNKHYNIVTSPKTGRIWLDRNLGASRVCKSGTDLGCFGDLYQFGRAADGHQRRSHSNFKTTQTNTITPNVETFFITGKDWTSADSSGSLRNAAWSNGGKNSICPAGFSVPTMQELLDEKIDFHSSVSKNFLKLPIAGRRVQDDGTLIKINVAGYYWSKTVSNDFQAQGLRLLNSGVSSSGFYRNQGLSVRCIQKATHAGIRYVRESMTVSGIRYKAVLVGSQIWTAENMRHGTNSMVDGIHSYDNNPSNDALYGKYYTFSAAMNHSKVEGSQGICASGWHIPTEKDWQTLEASLGMSKLKRQLGLAWRGVSEGDELIKFGDSGFNAVMSGRIKDNVSMLKNKETSFWSSNLSDVTHSASLRSLKEVFSKIYRGSANPDRNALSVRCVKNPLAPMSVAGINYKTFKIGKQIWTIENMRHNATSGRVFTYYGDDVDSLNIHGKLYNWEAAMNGSKVEGAQGICASGWHIPTERDWTALEVHLDMDKVNQNTLWAWRGLVQGDALKERGYSGFNAPMSGKVKENVTMGRGKEVSFWSSSQLVINKRPQTLFRSLKSSSSKIYKGDVEADAYGFHVRCMKDKI